MGTRRSLGPSCFLGGGVCLEQVEREGQQPTKKERTAPLCCIVVALACALALLCSSFLVSLLFFVHFLVLQLCVFWCVHKRAKGKETRPSPHSPLLHSFSRCARVCVVYLSDGDPTLKMDPTYGRREPTLQKHHSFYLLSSQVMHSLTIHYYAFPLHKN